MPRDAPARPNCRRADEKNQLCFFLRNWNRSSLAWSLSTNKAPLRLAASRFNIAAISGAAALQEAGGNRLMQGSGEGAGRSVNLPELARDPGPLLFIYLFSNSRSAAPRLCACAYGADGGNARQLAVLCVVPLSTWPSADQSAGCISVPGCLGTEGRRELLFLSGPTECN